MNSKALVFMVLLALAAALGAVKVRQIEKTSLADFQKGNFVNVSIDSNGRLFLGPKLKTVAGPAEEFYLSAAAAANGDLYLGTGHNAAVYRVDAAGKSERIFKGEQLDVYALLVAGNGDVIAGTSPNGRVYRIGKDNKVSELFNPDEKFIWDLAEDKQGNIICALGNTGAVYSIAKTGHGGEPVHGRGFAYHQPACHPRQRDPGRQRRPRHPLRDQEPQGAGAVRFAPRGDQGHRQRR